MSKGSVVADGRNGTPHRLFPRDQPTSCIFDQKGGWIAPGGAIIYPGNHDRDIAIYLTFGCFAMGGRLVSGAGNVFAEGLTLLWRK